MVIGVFDSGVGGLSVANAIKEALPEHDVLLRQDVEHLPYGNKTIEEVHKFVMPVLQSLVDDGCEVIVIACNTVSTNLMDKLRELFKVPLIGVEPMVKSASELTKSKVIAVCATPLTLNSDRYKKLKKKYCEGIEVLEPDCADWAYMIENNEIDNEKIKERISAVIKQDTDVIVLGCTHYHWIEEEIRALAGTQASVIQPEQAVIKRLWRVLEQQP
jgi:glutamate racemase